MFSLRNKKIKLLYFLDEKGILSGAKGKGSIQKPTRSLVVQGLVYWPLVLGVQGLIPTLDINILQQN